jgi:hypothetical protein
MQPRRFRALPMRTAYIEKQRSLHPYRNGRIVKSYVSGVLSPKKLLERFARDFNLAKVPALAGGSPETPSLCTGGCRQIAASVHSFLFALGRVLCSG